MHSDWYTLFSHYWWLIFPLFWLIARGMNLTAHHQRARQALDIIKTYADQGKEPPAELLQTLRYPTQDRASRGDWTDHTWRGHGWVPVFLFAALAAGFAVMAVWPNGTMRPHAIGLVFVAIVMTGLCLGNLVALLARSRNGDDRTPPK